MTDFDLLDVLSGADDEHDRHLAALKRYSDIRAVCPDRRALGPGETWCGRCGQTVRDYDMVNNHDLGYCGCPAELDPTWSRYPAAPGFRTINDGGRARTMLTKEELCERWDRQFIADCRCRHPFGVHRYGSACGAYCGCRGYEVAS